MLGPFVIRDLVSQPARSLQQAAGNIQESRPGDPKLLSDPSVLPPQHGIMTVSEREYDDTISENPNAKLMYLDEEDHELVTVGSSLELAQRLNDPVETGGATSQQTAKHTSPQEKLHEFEIQPTESVISTWQAIHNRSQFLLLSAAVHPSHNVKASSPVYDGLSAKPVSPRSTQSITTGHHSVNVRDRWVNYCNPPHVSVSSASAEVQGVPLAGHQATNPATGMGISHSSSGGSLTQEGIRQAQEAGAKLRNARTFYPTQSQVSWRVPVATENPWTAYSAVQPDFSPKPFTIREPKSPESPVEAKKDSESLVEENPRPLWAAFESEMMKLVNEKFASEGDGAAQAEMKSPGEPKQQPAAAADSTSTAIQTAEQVALPAEMLASTMQSLLSGVRHLTSELRGRLPDVERQISNAQQRLPPQVEATVDRAVKSIGGQVQSLAKAIQDAASSSRAAAKRVRDAESDAAEQAVNGLQELAKDLGRMGRTMFSKFESSGPNNSSSQQTTSATNTKSQPEADAMASVTEPEEEIVASDQMQRQRPSLIHFTSHRRVSESVTESTTPLNHLPTCDVDGSDRIAQKAQLTSQTLSPSRPPLRDTLFIGNLPSVVTEEGIVKALARHGFVGTVSLPLDSQSGKHPGFGYVQFPSIHAAFGALQALNGTFIGGRPVNVEYSQWPGQASDSQTTQLNSDGAIAASIATGEQARSHSQPPEQENHRDFDLPRTGSPELPPRPAKTLARVPSAPLESTEDTSNIRRAKSLGALRRPYPSFVPTPRESYTTSSFHQRPSYPSAGEDQHHNYPSVPTVYPQSRSLQLPTILDREDSDSEFAIRYPALLPGVDNLRRYQPSTHGEGIPARSTLSPVSSMARFPSISQLEAEDLEKRGRFTNERRPVRGLTERDSRSQLTLAEQEGIPGAWPAERSEPFRGVDEDWYSRPVNFPQTRGSERDENGLSDLNPAMPSGLPTIADTFPAPIWRRHTTHGSARRPRRNSADRRQLRHSLSQRARGITPGLNARQVNPPTHFNDARFERDLENTPGSFPHDIRHGTHRHHTLGGNTGNDIEECTRHLLALGFGGGDSSILRVYAEAANGNLEDAIEMVEEERKAYEQRSSELPPYHG